MKYNKPLVEIVWLDAETNHGWELDSDVDVENVPIITVGFLIRTSPDIIVIASSIDKNAGDQSNSRIKIPSGMVQSIRELNVSYKKPRKESNDVSGELQSDNSSTDAGKL